MFLEFFLLIKHERIPVTLREYLHLLEALSKNVVGFSVDEFYFLCRSVLIKHEKYYDRFDQLFSHYFSGTQLIPNEQFFSIPKEWTDLNKMLHLSEEEKALIEGIGGWDALMEKFKQLLEEQNERHEGGNKYIGTGGKSSFGAYGYNPVGYRIGQEFGRHGKAVKVWDKREYRNYDQEVELNTRNLKMALRKLRLFTREGIADELDIDTTINNTCKNAGILDIEMVPSKQNKVKVLLFLDAGGSMDGFSQLCSQLFSAAKHEFKHLEYFYFHNCIYETLWKDNNRRHERVSTWNVLNKYNKDYKLIVVGDAYMSPYEVTEPGASVEHYNPEAGSIWLQRLTEHYPHFCWLCPTDERYWNYAPSLTIIRELFQYRMYPLSVAGLSEAMKALKDKHKKYKAPN